MQPLDLLLLAALAAFFWLIVVRPARQRREAQAALVASLAPGQRIMTSAGVFGTVVDVGDERVRVEVAPGVVLEMVAQAVAQVIDSPAEVSAEQDGEHG